MIHETDKKKILDACWAACCRAQAAIDILENIGLSVDGAAVTYKGNMSTIYGAMSASADAILACMGIQKGTDQSEEASMVIADATDEERASDAMPARIRSALEDIADTGFKKSMLPNPEGSEPYDVTVSLTGSIVVMAADPDSAIERVNGMSEADVVRHACWISADATDASKQ